MNVFVKMVIDYAAKKYREPSSWIPIVSGIAAALHYNVPPDLQTAIDVVAAAVVSALLIAVNERKGPNPLNAPLPADPVMQHGAEAAVSQSPASVQPGPDTGSNPGVLDDGTPYHPPIRPGFGRD